ncbi:protein WALLS ARE THIN 1-like isoform X2 [Juglans microcarpa x Juglans regia]|nr:protein WALLS ARE THIN 1-like isoform X2 [Juglans microcarpa x Juglans regia]
MPMVPERAKLHLVMTLWQFGYAGNHIILRSALNMGISKIVFPLYRNAIALFVLAPSAYFSEKNDRPPLTTSILIEFFLLGFIGITCNHGSYLLGLDKTSPTFASATENIVPAVTFLIAALLRIEQVHLNRKDGRAKVLGTAASVAGASLITLYKGPAIYTPNSHLHHQSRVLLSLGDDEGENWTLGCIYLIVHCLCWSSWIVLQAPLLKKYPARLSATSYSCFFSVLQFLAIAAYFEKDSQAWQVHSSAELFSIFYTGLVASAMGFAVQTWVVDRAGPVFVSVYLPVQTLLVAVMASVVLGEEFYLGGVIGAVLIVAGLYLVVWGKSEESKFAMQKASIPSMPENKKRKCPSRSPLIQPLITSFSE